MVNDDGIETESKKEKRGTRDLYKNWFMRIKAHFGYEKRGNFGKKPRISCYFQIILYRFYITFILLLTHFLSTLCWFLTTFGRGGAVGEGKLKYFYKNIASGWFVWFRQYRKDGRQIISILWSVVSEEW